MTTVQTMLKGELRADRAIRAQRGPRISPAAVVLCVIALLGAQGCARQGDRLYPPHVLTTPYDATEGDVLWAVAPLANESGTSLADPLAVADSLAARITETRGITAIPVNRTITAMRALGLKVIASPTDARAVADALGADGIIAGSVTAFDPYDPPKIGLSLALYARSGRLRTGADWLDPHALSMAYTDGSSLEPTGIRDEPVSVVSGHLDGANHEVEMDVRNYAVGRHDYDSALGWRRYLASMDLYTDFAAYWAIDRLLESERLRLSRLVHSEQQAAR